MSKNKQYRIQMMKNNNYDNKEDNINMENINHMFKFYKKTSKFFFKKLDNGYTLSNYEQRSLINLGRQAVKNIKHILHKFGNNPLGKAWETSYQLTYAGDIFAENTACKRYCQKHSIKFTNSMGLFNSIYTVIGQDLELRHNISKCNTFSHELYFANRKYK